MYNILQSKYLPQEQTIENMAEWSVRTKYSFTKKKQKKILFFSFVLFFVDADQTENALLLKVTSIGRMAVAGWSFFFSFFFQGHKASLKLFLRVWWYDWDKKKKGMGIGVYIGKVLCYIKKEPKQNHSSAQCNGKESNLLHESLWKCLEKLPPLKDLMWNKEGSFWE